MKLSSLFLKLLFPALLGLSATAGAAESAKDSPVAKQPLAKSQQRVTNKTNQTADESHLQQMRDRPHNGINSDAGVPPSGVPSETMNA